MKNDFSIIHIPLIKVKKKKIQIKQKTNCEPEGLIKFGFACSQSN